MFISKARKEGINLVLIQQPMIFSNKKLIGIEKEIYYHKSREFFSLSTNELNELNQVPPHEINRKFFKQKRFYKWLQNTK